MNQLQNQKDIWNEDFKIYDEFCENMLGESNDQDQDQEGLTKERIYQNLIEMIGGNEVFEDIFYLRENLEQEENEYEIVDVKRNRLNRRLRSLKTLSN